MTKEELQKLHISLSSIISDFSLAYQVYKKGSNQKKRNEGERDYQNAIRRAEILIENNRDLFNLLHNGDDFKNIEATTPIWFERDMCKWLRKIQEKINISE